MKISVTIPTGSVLEIKLMDFNKHERSALIKMALQQWFNAGAPPNTAQTSGGDKGTTFQPFANTMGDFLN